MAQRQLRVQVTSQVDKSLTDLLSKLDKYSRGTTTINVKAVTNSKDVIALFNTVNKLKNKRVRVDVDSNGNKVLKVQKDLLALKNKTVSVKVDADTRSITKVSSDLNGLKGKTFKVNADLSGINKAKSDIDAIDDKVNKNRTVKIHGDTSGLTAISNALDSISSKVLALSARGALNIGKSFAKDAGELYDAQNEFVNNMRSLDNPLSDKEINSTLKNLSKYGAQTKYNVAELTNLAGALKGAGFDKEFGGFDNLTKNLANISALASSPSNALKRVSTQIKQMSLDGKVLARDWNPIRDAIGGTATQKVVQKFKDEYGFDNLADAMKEGKVLGRDFIKVLNEVGQDPALLKAATNTKTLKSAWENMRESLTVGLVGTPFEPGALTPAIDGLVKLMNTVSENGDVIQNFVSKGVGKAMSLFKEMFGEFDFKQGLKDFVTYLAPVGKGIELLAKGFAKINANGKNTGKILGGIITASAGWLVVSKMARSVRALSSTLGLLKNFKNPFSRGGSSGSGGASGGSTSLLGGLTKSLGDSAKMLAFAGSIKLIASAFKDISNTDMDFTEATVKVGTMVTMVSAMAGYAVVLGKILQRKELGKDLLIGATAIAGVVTGMLLMAKTMEQLNNVKFDTGKVYGTVLAMNGLVVIVGLIATTIGALMVATEGIGALALGAGLVSMLAIAGTMVVVAKAMESVAKTVARINKVKLPNAGTFGKKMANFTALVTEMSLASSISGNISTLALLPSIFGTISNLAQAIQVESIILLANQLTKLQGSVKNIPDKSKFKDTVKKLKNMTELINELSSVSGGGIKNPVDALKSIGNTFSNIVKGFEVNSLSDNVTKVANLIATLSRFNMPDDISGLKNKLKNIANIQKTLESAFADISVDDGSKFNYSDIFTHLNNSIASMLKGWETSNNTKMVEKLVKFINEIQNVEIPDNVEPIKTQLEKLGQVQKALSQAFATYSAGNISVTDPVFTSISALGTFFDSLATSNLISTVKKLTQFIKDINEVEVPSDTSAIDEKISNLTNVMNSLKKLGNDSWLDSINFISKGLEALTSKLDGASLDAKFKSFTKLIDFVKKISDLKLDDAGLESIETKLENLKKTLQTVSKFKVDTPPDIKDDVLKGYENFKKLTDKIKGITDSLNNIPDGLDISSKIESVKNALSKISELATLDIFGKDTPFNKDVTSNIKSVTEFTSKLSSIASSLNEINSIEDLSGIPAKIEQLRQALQSITQAGENGGSLMSMFDAFKGKSDYGKLAEEASNMINSLKTIADSLSQIPDLINIEGSGIETRVAKIQSVLKSLTDSDTGSFIQDIGKLAKVSEAVGQVTSVVNSFKTMAETLMTIPDLINVEGSGIETRVAKIKSVLQSLASSDDSGLTTSLQNIQKLSSNIMSAVQAVNNILIIANAINQFPEVNADNFNNSINAIKTAIESLSGINDNDAIIGNLTNVLNTINQLQNALAQFASMASSLGQQSGSNFSNGFVSGLGSRIVDKMNEQKNQIENLGWEALGASISSKIANGFDVSSVLNKIQQIQSAIDSLRGKTVDITINETTVKSTKKRQHGGIIPEYHSTGGVVGRRSFASLGTDTIPAMLTAGEYVLKRSVSSMLGKQFLDNLNQMNLTQALKALAVHTSHSVVNNTTNNITQNVDNKASFINGLSEIKGVVRP
nr:MAG TPA: tail tape measure [Bacteriophage sp.]